MAADYGYGNARLRAMRSRLLTLPDYEALLRSRTIDEAITALTATPYKEDIESVLVQYGGVRCIFEALSANLKRTLRQIRGFFEGEPGHLIDLILRRWDRHNLLAVLRGQSQEARPEHVLSAIVPAGQIDETSLRELARQPGIRAVIDLMAAWHLPYAGPLLKVRARSGAVPDLDQLELALNNAHFAMLRSQLRPGRRDHDILRQHLLGEIDLTNLGTALRIARFPELVPVIRQRYHANDMSPLFVHPGGFLDTKLLVAQLAESGSLEDLVARLASSKWGAALQAGWARYQAGETALSVI